jgi:hypothetical protein
MIRDRDGIYGEQFRRRVEGIGIEQVLTAPRSPWQNPYADLALVRQFFTEREATLVAEAGPACDEVVARIWSAKEAVLKLLGLGLRLDTREIEVSLDGVPFGEGPAGWQTLDVQLGPTLFSALPPGSLRVVWRRESGVVLTVAVAAATG